MIFTKCKTRLYLSFTVKIANIFSLYKTSLRGVKHTSPNGTSIVHKGQKGGVTGFGFNTSLNIMILIFFICINFVF